MKFKELREKYRSKFPSSLVAAAVKIALDMGGNMTGAHKKIEAMKKGLANDPMVKDALRQANESVNESSDGSFKLVDMDDKSYKNALMLAKKAKLNPFSKKTSTGMELSVFGDNKSIMKFLKSLPESVKEGKYTAYSDLLLMKDRIIDKEGHKSEKLPAVDSQIKIVMKKLGIKEGTEIQEGTWDIPDTKTKLQKLMDLVSKPYFATTEKEVDKYLKLMPFGDDELYDDLGVLYFIPGSTKSKKFPKTDLNQVAMDSLNGRWLTAKKKGNGWDITHINFDVDMEETIKRKYGNLRPGKRMKLDF